MSSHEERWTREVVEIVAGIAEVEPERVEAEASLAALGLDSLDGLRVVAAVEKRFGVVIEEREIGAIRTMGDILAIVRRHAAGND
jgi:acyl carrier protein